MIAQKNCAFIRPLVRSCPDFRAFMIRILVRSPDYSCVHDQTFVRSPGYSCVHDQTFVRSPDYSCVHDQTFVRSPDYSCVHDQTFVRSPDYSCVHDQTFVRSPDYSCVHGQTFVRSPDNSCVHDQTFVRFSLFPDHVNLNARHPRRAFIWVWTYRLSVWDLNLGILQFYAGQLKPVEVVFLHLYLHFRLRLFSYDSKLFITGVLFLKNRFAAKVCGKMKICVKYNIGDLNVYQAKHKDD